MFESYSVYASVHRHQRSCTLKLGYHDDDCIRSLPAECKLRFVGASVKDGEEIEGAIIEDKNENVHKGLLRALGHALQEIGRKMG